MAVDTGGRVTNFNNVVGISYAIRVSQGRLMPVSPMSGQHRGRGHYGVREVLL